MANNIHNTATPHVAALAEGCLHWHVNMPQGQESGCSYQQKVKKVSSNFLAHTLEIISQLDVSVFN